MPYRTPTPNPRFARDEFERLDRACVAAFARVMAADALPFHRGRTLGVAWDEFTEAHAWLYKLIGQRHAAKWLAILESELDVSPFFVRLEKEGEHG